MYWPVGTPRAYATSSNHAQPNSFLLSRDGLPSIKDESEPEPSTEAPPRSPHISRRPSQLRLDQTALAALKPPTTPITPLTPAVQSIEHDEHDDRDDLSEPDPASPLAASTFPSREPILALRVSRSGHIFAVITATTMTIWQTKPTVVLAVVARSESSIRSYGENIDLLLRPDTAIFVVHTSLGYLITYSMATDLDARVYRPHFPSYHNVQKRRQSNAGGPGALAPDQILWGPGEGSDIKDTSVRFRMVIKVDAGIESALALDDELIVATRKPAAIQCIRWSPDTTGKQTRTELVSKMSWLENKVPISKVVYDKPMGLFTWITSDGRAYAVQRLPPAEATSSENVTKKLFKGHCFHVPEDEGSHAVHAVVNARFSLIAVACADSSIHVYWARDYAGNITPSHIHIPPVPKPVVGAITTLSYSADGHCLFAGFQKGWATWSVYGKAGSHSFVGDEALGRKNKEDWISCVHDASWVSGSSELLLTNHQSDTIWVLEMARSAAATCYAPSNLFRTALQTPTSIIIYRGYDLPDLTTISSESLLWHTAAIPATYLLHQWPIRYTVVSPDGRYVAVAGRHGLAHYSVNSGRWKTFANREMDLEFHVRGGMCWYQHILVAAVESNKSSELRLFSREAVLDNSLVLHIQALPAPVVLLTSSGDDSILVYTNENMLYHFIFTSTAAGSVSLVQVGQIAFHGIVRAPARVRGLSWVLPDSQLVDGDPSKDVMVASVLFLVDGKLVMLRPSVNEEGQLKYDMRVIAQNVEFHASMRDDPFSAASVQRAGVLQGPASTDLSLKNSLWFYDGVDMKVWPDIQAVLTAVSGESSRELPAPMSLRTEAYPLTALLDKAIVLGIESDLVQRRDVTFSFFRFAIRSHLMLPEMLHFYLSRKETTTALQLCRQYQDLTYFPHSLEVLLHRVLDDEVDSSPSPGDALLPRVLSLLSSFKEYLDIVLQCTRKTEVRQWRTLFAYLPPVQELFEESLIRGSVKTAGGYLIVLHTLEESESVTEQSVRVLSRAIKEEDWELCKELARFLAALDETGNILRDAMTQVNIPQGNHGSDGDLIGKSPTRLQLPHLNGMDDIGSRISDSSPISDEVSGSDAGSID